MSTLTVPIDDRMRRQLEDLSRAEGVGTEDMAGRLLRRALLRSRPRPAFDAQAVREANAPFAEEDLALAESDGTARLEALQNEDAA